MERYQRLALETPNLTLFAECDVGSGDVYAVVCEGDGWRVREEVLNSEFDLAFSRVLTDLRRRLQLTEAQMVWLESHRYCLALARQRSDAAA